MQLRATALICHCRSHSGEVRRRGCIVSNVIVETGAGLPTFVTPRYTLFIPYYVLTSLRHNGNHPSRDRAAPFDRVSLTVSDTGSCRF
jgi:hypothetical protein